MRATAFIRRIENAASVSRSPRRLALRLCPLAVLAVAAVAATAAPADASEPACSAGSDTAALVWGYNGGGRLGLGYTSGAEHAPAAAPSLEHLREFRAGFQYQEALLSNVKIGVKEYPCTLWSWGFNWQGALGDGLAAKMQDTPSIVIESEGKPLTEIAEVAVAGDHSLALGGNGAVWTWGVAEFGERGNGESGYERKAREKEPSIAVPRDKATKIVVEAEGHEQKVVQVAAGGAHDYALLANGEVAAWGEDKAGQLGVKEEPLEPVTGSSAESESCYGEREPVACSTRPRLVYGSGKPISKVVRIAAGLTDAYAVTESGEVLAWGDNTTGELGDNSTASATGAVKVASMPSRVVELAAGNNDVLARLEDGQIYGWGADEWNELGAAEATGVCHERPCSLTPIRVPGLEHVKQVAAAGSASAAVAEVEGTRKAYTWGAAKYAVLGQGFLPAELQPEHGVVLSISETPATVDVSGAVAQISLSTNNGALALESGSAPTPLFSVTPGSETLHASWDVPAEEYVNLRWRPVGEKKYSKKLTNPCFGEVHACTYEIKAYESKELKSVPYEVDLSTETSGGAHSNGRKATVTPEPPEGYPKNIVAPSIIGAEEGLSGEPYVHVGSPVTVDAGEWTGTPSLTYTWLLCAGLGLSESTESLGTNCHPIENAYHEELHGESYLPTEADFGYSLAVKVEATNVHGETAAVSEGTLVLGAGEEAPPAAPALSGERPQVLTAGHTTVAVPGTTVKVEPGVWTGTFAGKEAIEDKWELCKSVKEGLGTECHGIKITNEEGEKEADTQESYEVPAEGDEGDYLQIFETADGPGGMETALSRPVLVAPTGETRSKRAPAISGENKVGRTLTVTPGEWEYAKTGSETWRWKRLWIPKGGGEERSENIPSSVNKTSIEVKSAYKGEKIEVEETAESWGRTKLTVFSNVIEIEG